MVVSARMGGFGGKAREAGVGARQILSPRLLFPTDANDHEKSVSNISNLKSYILIPKH